MLQFFFSANPTTATIGGTPLTLSNVTPNSFTFTTPPGPAAGGLENVIATEPLGSSPATTGSAYLYIPLSNYVPVTPLRVLDTRGTGGPFGPGVTRPLQVTVGTVPSNATAAVLNVTEVNGSASSLLTVYPFNTSTTDLASNLNFGPGTVIADLITVTLGASSGEGWIDIYNALGSVNVLVDVEGYFTTHPATTLTVSSTRLCRSESVIRQVVRGAYGHWIRTVDRGDGPDHRRCAR